jgi:hypothetical protein
MCMEYVLLKSFHLPDAMVLRYTMTTTGGIDDNRLLLLLLFLSAVPTVAANIHPMVPANIF